MTDAAERQPPALRNFLLDAGPSFIAIAGPGLLGTAITGGSVLANVTLSFLELLVAFIQAYVFTFLTALYIGGALHPHH